MTAIITSGQVPSSGVWIEALTRALARRNFPRAAADVIRRDFALSDSSSGDAQGRLILDTHCGSVRIAGTDTRRVGVRIAIHRSDGRPVALPAIDIAQDEDGVLIRSRRKGALRWLPAAGRLRMCFEVTVPRGFHVEVSTRGGSVEVNDVGGDVSVRTAGGWLSFRNLGGQLQARTAGGGIEVDGCRGDLAARSGSTTKWKAARETHAAVTCAGA